MALADPIVQWPRTPPFHGGNTGSNPVRVAPFFKAKSSEFDVMVGAPDVTQVSADSPYYAGTIAFFGSMMHRCPFTNRLE